MGMGQTFPTELHSVLRTWCWKLIQPEEEINSPQMRSVVVLILCIYFWIYLRPPRCSNSTPFGGPVSLLGGQAPPGVRVILTLIGTIGLGRLDRLAVQPLMHSQFLSHKSRWGNKLRR